MAEEAQALISSLVNQRNQALDNFTRTEAALIVARQKIQELEKQVEKCKKKK